VPQVDFLPGFRDGVSFRFGSRCRWLLLGGAWLTTWLCRSPAAWVDLSQQTTTSLSRPVPCGLIVSVYMICLSLAGRLVASRGVFS